MSVGLAYKSLRTGALRAIKSSEHKNAKIAKQLQCAAKETSKWGETGPLNPRLRVPHPRAVTFCHKVDIQNMTSRHNRMGMERVLNNQIRISEAPANVAQAFCTRFR